MLVFLFFTLLPNMCSYVSQISPFFLTVTAKRPQWKKGLIPIMVLVSLLSSVPGMLSLTAYTSVPPPPHFWYGALRQDDHLLSRGHSAESWSVPGAPQMWCKIITDVFLIFWLLHLSLCTTFAAFFSPWDSKSGRSCFCYDSWHGHTSLTICALK